MKGVAARATEARGLARRVAGLVPSPLFLALRAATQLVTVVRRQPLASPTPAQQVALRAGSAQLRALTRTVLPSAQAGASASVEGALGELIAQTLAMVEDALGATPPVICAPCVGNEVHALQGSFHKREGHSGSAKTSGGLPTLT